MNTKYPENWPQFYTATIEGWKNLLEKDHYKMVIINSLQFLVKNKQVRISAFVIMSNHIHLIWHAEHGYDLKNVQTSFKKFTSSQFLKLTKAENNEEYKVSSADRSHIFGKEIH